MNKAPGVVEDPAPPGTLQSGEKERCPMDSTPTGKLSGLAGFQGGTQRARLIFFPLLTKIRTHYGRES
jgi:hypothetical protein